jgi:hypothetical protein
VQNYQELYLLGNFLPILLKIGNRVGVHSCKQGKSQWEKPTSFDIFVLLIDGQPPPLRKSKSYSVRDDHLDPPEKLIKEKERHLQ